MSRNTPEWRAYYKKRYDLEREQNKKIKSNKLCECGCGQYTGVAMKTSTKAGVVKGMPLRFLPNHNTDHLHTKEVKDKIKAKSQDFETRKRKSKSLQSRHGNKAKVILSPYVPETIIRYNKQSGYWNCRVLKNGKRVGTHHAKAVYEHHFGEVPENYEVHHINNRHSEIEDDKPENLVAIPRIWNRDHIPSLMVGFGIDCETITNIYLKHKDKKDCYIRVCKDLINLN